MDLPSFSNSTFIAGISEIISIPSPPAPETPETRPPLTQRHKRPTECSVCGKPANGYHYDVPSCNGCKTFFRRLTVSEKHLVCQYQNDCFDLTIRAHPLKCRACRYQKCITVGMNILAMEIDEKEAMSANFKKQVTKRKKGEEETDEKKDDAEVIAHKQVIKVMDSFENRLQKMVDMLSYLEQKLDQFRMSAYNPHWTELNGVEDVLQSPNRISLAERYGPMPGWPLTEEALLPHPPPPPSSWKPGLHVGPPPHRTDRKQWFIFNLLTSMEYVKTFMFFHQLDSKDRLILAKHVTLACTNLHVSFSVVSRKFDTLIHPDGSNQHYRDATHYNNTVMSIGPLIRYGVQNVEYILIKAIFLCNPAIPDLSKRAQIILTKEREKFADALFDHCLRSGRDGPSRFADLIGLIDLLERQQRMQKDIHLLQISSLIAKLPKEHTIRLIEDIMDC